MFESKIINQIMKIYLNIKIDISILKIAIRTHLGIKFKNILIWNVLL
jgi:hypothetical protein